jgi:uncharacterized membrane protein
VWTRPWKIGTPGNIRRHARSAYQQESKIQMNQHTDRRAGHDHHDINLHSLERCLSGAAGVFLVASGAGRGFRGGTLRILLGAEMIRRGVTGRSFTYRALGVRTASRSRDTGVPRELGVRERVALTIGRPREEVFNFWRDFSNLPTVMHHLLSVEPRTNGITRWTVEGLLGKHVSWEAEVVSEVENERIAWRSLPGSSVDTEGSVCFRDAPRGLGTELLIGLVYNPPAGHLGAYCAKLFGRDARASIEADCWRLKEYLETGEVSTTDGQPKGPSARESRRRRAQSASRATEPLGATG